MDINITVKYHKSISILPSFSNNKCKDLNNVGCVKDGNSKVYFMIMELRRDEQDFINYSMSAHYKINGFSY